MGSGKSILTFKDGDGKDTIYMTKDTGKVYTRLQGSTNEEYSRKGHDLVIKRNKNVLDKDSDFITIKDYFTQTTEHFYNKTNGKSYKDMLNGSEFTSLRTYEAPKMNKAAKLSGSFLNDTIIGSNKNDKIYTNGGSDVITPGKGNDTVYVDGGEDSSRKSTVQINLRKGDGVDTVYLRNVDNIENLIFNIYSDGERATYYSERAKNGKDLILHYYFSGEFHLYPAPDRLVIKDFYSLSPDKQKNMFRVCRYESNDPNPYIGSLSHQYNYIHGELNKPNKINVEPYSAMRYRIIGGNKNDTIYVNDSSKYIIEAGKGDDYIVLSRLAEGNDTIMMHYGYGDGTDTIITKDLKNTEITLYSYLKYFKSDNGDLIMTSRSNPYTFEMTNTKLVFKEFLNLENNNIITSYSGQFKPDAAGLYLTQANGVDEQTGMFIGSDKDDYIIAGSLSDTIYAGKGDDVIVTDKGSHVIDGGEGKNALVLKNLKAHNTVKNVQNVQYNGKLSDLYFGFDVDSLGNIVPDENGDKYITIGNSSIFTNNNVGSDIDISTLKTLYTSDKKGSYKAEVDMDNMIKIIAGNVAEYLKKTGYKSAQELYEKGSKKQRQELINIYKKRISTNDTITVTSDNSELVQAGAGNDTYIISKDRFTSDSTLIDDASGKSDVLELTGVTKDEVFLDVEMELKKNKKGKVLHDKHGNPQYKISASNSSLYLVSNFEEGTGITIGNYFGSGKIETIKLGDGSIFNVNSRLLEIAKWLDENGFSSNSEAYDADPIKYYAFIEGKNLIDFNNPDEVTATDGDDFYRISNITKDLLNIDLKNGNDTLVVTGKNENPLAKVNVITGTGNKTISYRTANDVKIDCSNADSVRFYCETTGGNFDITGSDGSDEIRVYSGSDAKISTGAGDDKIIIESYNKSYILDGGAGNDKYNFRGINNKIEITDAEGNDELRISAIDYSNMIFYFNVKSDATFADGEDKLSIFNPSGYDKLMNGQPIDKSITINGFNSIETIKDKDDRYVGTADLEAVKESVAGWLAGKGYADVNEVFTAEKTDGDITALIAEFRNISWHT